jgi:transposase InsO family protein
MVSANGAQQFLSLEASRSGIETWRFDYNRQRPQSLLGDLTPIEFERNCREKRTSYGTATAE